jgi:hypothetical protein
MNFYPRYDSLADSHTSTIKKSILTRVSYINNNPYVGQAERTIHNATYRLGMDELAIWLVGVGLEAFGNDAYENENKQSMSKHNKAQKSNN